MWKNAKYRLESTAPLLMHNSRLSDPIDPHSMALKKLTGKRDKTEADHLAISETEFRGSLYHTKELGPVLPSNAVHAAVVNAAKSQKKGKQANIGFRVLGAMSKLIYDGPRTPEELFAEKDSFALRCPAKVGKAMTQRTRPKFDKWAAEVEVMFDDGVFNADQIDELLSLAGRNCGLLDWRPRFGTFTAKRVSTK